jgi:hypothetical protein
MSEPKDLLDQLRRSNRRWRALALAACSTLILVAIVAVILTARQRAQAELALRRVNAALAEAHALTSPAETKR